MASPCVLRCYRGDGERRAVELSLTGRTADAVPEALTMGLIWEVIGVSNLLESTSVQAARAVAGSSAEVMARGLRYVNDTRGRTWEEAGATAHQ